MLIVRLRNLLLNWTDSVAEARLYWNPVWRVYPPAKDDPNPYDTTNSNGEVQYDIAGFPPGEHTLWIVPKYTTTDPVGYWTAIGADVARIYRGLRIQLSIGNQNNVTDARVHSSTMDNGTLVAHVASVKEQVLDVRLRPMWIKSPYNYGRTQKIDMIVVHKTGGDTIGSAINQFLSGGTSAHYLVDRDGQVVKMVLDSQAAGHASHENDQDQSHWGTQTGLAWRSIGIENVGTTKQGLTDAQYQSLTRLIQELMRYHGVPRHRVVGHSDILTDGQGHLSDQRIACPGYQFEWSRLENANPGIGLARTGGGAGGADPVAEFFKSISLGGSPPPALRPGDHDPRMVGGKPRPGRFGGREIKDVTETPIKHLQTWLAEIGYSVGPADGQFNPRMARAVRHFQVHFEGRSDSDTINARTAALIRAVRDANPKAD
ncbi:MAG: N-acetylmuramoyl-L-alanine amidase [Candidatus Contendobacter sp.]|nr:N-acetylmuramoyl-L-alanine amidase [Candidatus Contendobacter sp.]MDG4557419.1 N-acetylmuramoyl-L-alanine amidase [Candidatus Contendobacter sp.]